MLDVPYIVVIIFLIAYAIAGMTIGALSGWLTSLTTKCGPRGVYKDAFLGSVGFLVGFFACAYMPWPRNTIVERLEGGGSVATTYEQVSAP